MTDKEKASPTILAKRCAKYMWDRDNASKNIGMRLDKIDVGTATVSMKVVSTMLNGQGCCHGGYLFALADSAFAFACNSYDNATLAQGCSIEYIRPAKDGDHLIATAIEISRGKRTGVYDTSVVNQEGKMVALFRGKSFASNQSLINT